MHATFQLITFSMQAYLNLQSQAPAKQGGRRHSSSFLKDTVTTLLHTISESEKACYVAHINSYLGDDPFLKQYLPLNPASNDIFNLAKDGVLLWYISMLVVAFYLRVSESLICIDFVICYMLCLMQ